MENSTLNRPNNNLVLTIVATVLGCVSFWWIGIILGGVGIYFSTTVNKLFDEGDTEQAEKNAKIAKYLAFAAFAFVIIGIIQFAMNFDQVMDAYEQGMKQAGQ